MATTTLLDLLMNLLRDPAEQQAFLADPSGYLQECGLADLSAEDVRDAVTLAADNPHHDWDGHGHHELPPAPPVHHHGHGGHSGHDADPHAEAADYLRTYITTTFVDDRRTFLDQSFHQDIDTHGGDVDQRIDLHQTTASGDDAVAVGGDDRAPVATGDHAVAGWGDDVVDGDDDTASFGSGPAVDQSGATADHGGALSGTGPATGTFTDSNDHLANFGSGSLADKGGDATRSNAHNDTSTDSHDDDHTDSHDDSHVDSGHNDTDTDTHTDTHTHVSDDHSVSDSHAVDNHPTDDHSFDLHV
ncbi:hypothetical protein GCM10023215_50220 [Pseudonocardia yuanmonensis]|uniref:Uncharacterized protein n=1 Tax=Pseudonocardia yuanmonensis TaxID=1095914 RepID=A0ABP8XFB3_9PSEU